MAFVALTSLMETIRLHFLQPTPRVSLHDDDDEAAIKSLFEYLSSLQAFLQKESSGDADDGGALRDLEIQIRDFALKAEDDIETQLSNILLNQDRVILGQPNDCMCLRATHDDDELHQTLREAAKNAAQLLKILAGEKELCVTETEMGSVALTILITEFKCYFLQRIPKTCFDGEAAMISFVENLSSLQALLQTKSNGDAAIKDLATKTRNFALKAEDDIGKQLSNFVLAKDTEHEEKASQELCQTLREAAEIAAELLKSFNRDEEHEIKYQTCVALTSLISTIELQFFQLTPMVSLKDKVPILSFCKNLYSLHTFLQEESSGALGDWEIQVRDFALKAKDKIEIQLSNILPAQETEYQEIVSHELHQTLREATKNATELLKIISKDEENERERRMTCAALTFLRVKIHQSLSDKGEIKSNFFKNLSALQVFLREESSGATTKDLKATIKDFALQLSNFFQPKETKSQQEASRELLYQALQEATENATELLEIITIEKEYHRRARKMASDALNVFMKKFYHDFLSPIPIVVLDDKAAMISFSEKLSSLQTYLRTKESSGGAAINDFEPEIRDFVLKAEDDIETQIKYAIQAKNNSEYREKASQLHRTLQESAEKVEELLMIINSEKECDEKTEKACVSISSLMGTIEKEVLDDEAVMKSFLEDISSLQAFLQKESSGGAAVRDLKTKIKDFALKAEDDIRKRQGEYQEKTKRESAAELLKIINNRNKEVDEANESQPSNSWLKHASKSPNVESGGSSLKLEDRMVGRHHDCTVIKDKLFSSNFDKPLIMIISIVGMVGIGKTTLAKNVYEDPSVALHFHARSWITIPQDYNESQMLNDLLQSIMPAEPKEIKKGSTLDELKEKVRIWLLGRRHLIVLDNILSIHLDWIYDIITSCFPHDPINGSCILLTTRYLKQQHDHFNYIHNMTLLDPNESWDLFCDILPIKEHMAPKFEKIKNHVVEKCDGLPQLIVEVAKRLSKCNNIQEGWKNIEKELESLGILDRNAITVSYNPLPHHLKVCFLYFGVFPKRNKIPVKMLIRLWIVEGFVKASKYKELEDEAYEHLQKLVNRSLLLIENRSSDGKIKTCRMHSAMHSFCVGEAQKEGILCAVDTQQHSELSLDAFASSCRWLSLCSHSFDYYVLFGTNIPRTIFFFHENPKMFVPLKLLRVLAFDTSISLQRVPVQLGDLVFLRYLSITKWFEDMDYVVSNNHNLQMLVVSGNGAPTAQLLSSIWKPPHLRHLELGNSYIVDPPSMVKENLQSLSCVMRSIHWRKEVFSKFPNIKNLKIFLKDDIEPNHIVGSCSNPVILGHFDYLKGLEKLSISVSIGCITALPEKCMYPSGLKKLKLSGINISERDLNVIAKLPKLMVLKLENAFHGTVWNAVAKGGFPELIFLLLEAKELKQLVVRGWINFPKLRHLVLRSCNCLERIPITRALKTIELEGCNSSLVSFAKWLQQMRRFRNVEFKILGPEYEESQNTHT